MCFHVGMLAVRGRVCAWMILMAELVQRFSNVLQAPVWNFTVSCMRRCCLQNFTGFGVVLNESKDFFASCHDRSDVLGTFSDSVHLLCPCDLTAVREVEWNEAFFFYKRLHSLSFRYIFHGITPLGQYQ